MGFIQEVIAVAGPAIGSVLTTAWSVISPIMDLCISVFELVFSVVQRVFPGIQSILESVWSVVQPIVEGIGSAIGKVADWISSTGAKIAGSGGSRSGNVGKNAAGDNNWRGGLTWVGEERPRTCKSAERFQDTSKQGKCVSDQQCIRWRSAGKHGSILRKRRRNVLCYRHFNKY